MYNSGDNERIQLKLLKKKGEKYQIKYNFCEYNQDNVKDQFNNCVNDIM